jgi:hypothetical protein
MKQFITCTLILIFTTAGFCQQNKLSIDPAMHDYMKKSKHQRTAAWILLGGGTIAWFAGVSKYMDQRDDIDGGGEIAMLIGGIAVASSVPLFIISRHNKKKGLAASAKLKIENAAYTRLGKINYPSFPALSFKIGL